MRGTAKTSSSPPKSHRTDSSEDRKSESLKTKPQSHIHLPADRPGTPPLPPVHQSQCSIYNTGLEELYSVQSPAMTRIETTDDLPNTFVPYNGRQSNFNGWSFTQGLLVGQLSVLIVLSAFVKFFIFGEPPEDRRQQRYSQSLKPSKGKASQQIRKKKSSILRNPPPSNISTILSKTYYNVNAHQPESLDWFNVLIAQTLAQFREEARTDDALLGSLDKVLNGPNKPSFLDKIRVTEISMGEEFPIFSNCRISPLPEDPGKLQATMDVDLSDMLTLGIETKLLLNYPKPMTATLPVALAVSIVRFSGTLSISLVPSTENQSKTTTLNFSFADDYRLDINVRSLVGSRSRLQDVPKIAQLVESRLHQWIDERCVEPKFQQIALPSMWPRKRTTREQQRQGDDEEVVPSPSGTLRRRNPGLVPPASSAGL